MPSQGFSKAVPKILVPGIPETRAALAPRVPETLKCKRCGTEFLCPPNDFGYRRLFCPTCLPIKIKEHEEEQNREAEARKQAALEAEEERRRDFIFDHGWLPPGRFFLEATLDNFDGKLQPKALQQIKAFLENREKGRLLHGPPGVGKTHLAAAVFNHFYNLWDPKLHRVPKARFVRENDLFLRLRASYKKEASETEGEILEGYTTPGVLIIDDLCKYQPADRSFRNRIYYELIDQLWTAETPLILTSNIPPEALVEELGAPIVDRLRDMCVVVEMKGASQRGKRGRATS